MFPRSDATPTRDARRAMRLAAIALLSITPLAPAQDQDAPAEVGDLTEAYLERLGLSDLRATYLRSRLERAPLEERLAIADRLGSLYAEMLDRAPTREERDEIVALGQELLASVPESRSFDLRINLAKARYLIAEEIAERARVRLAGEGEQGEALEILRAVASTLDQVGDQAHRLVEDLERRERRAREQDEQSLEAMLDNARRHRSLARYYAGWARYYSAMLSRTPAPTSDALRDFAWILGSGGERQPASDRVSTSLLRFEHVARAALGTALCHSERGDVGEALRWLDLLQNSPELPENLRGELFAQRLSVLAAARRWTDIEWMIHQRGRTLREGESRLSVGEARLLAVLTLERARASARPETEEIVAVLAQVALSELIRAGEVGHVLDLVRRYDATPIGEDGFIVRYVRGLRQFTDAREEHQRVEGEQQTPALSPALRVRYQGAGEAFALALRADDAPGFAEQSERAGVLRGLSLFYAGSLVPAAEAFETLARSARDRTVREEALWYAIVALDHLVEGAESAGDAQRERRDRLSTLFLSEFPASERSARLLLKRAGTDLLDPRAGAEILLSIDPASPLRAVAVRHASTLLYRVYRASPASERDFAALRFLGVASESVEGDLETIRDLDDAALIARAAELVARLRQILDAALGAPSPDASRARWALLRLEDLRGLASMDLSDVEDELAFRRFQLALAQGNEAESERELATLRRLGGKFSDAADRTMYRRALQAWEHREGDADRARAVVAHGSRVLSEMRSGGATLDDPALQSLADTIARAARTVWIAQGDAVLRDVAIAMDRDLLDAGVRPASVLERFAELSEAAGDVPSALDAWRTLLSALAPLSPSWYRARVESLRLLATIDPARAREALDQHKLLHPDLASQPEPWGARLMELDRTIPPAPSPQAGGGR